MMVFIMTLVIFVFIITAMAIGYILQRKTIAGSCGGLGSMGIEKACDCEKPCEKRQAKMKAEEQKLAQQKIDVTNV